MYQVNVDGEWVSVSVSLAYQIAKHHLVSLEIATPPHEHRKVWETLDHLRRSGEDMILTSTTGQQLRWSDH